jgi:hypothetical protein
MKTPQELLRAHGIDYVETKTGTYTTNCPTCKGGYLTVKIDRRGACWHCHDCKLSGPQPSEKEDKGSGDLGPIKAVFDYTNETGELLFQVLKFEPLNAPKAFRQRTDPGQQKWSIKGVRIVPYRLPELIADVAVEHVVFVTEGEKDVGTLRKHGVPATCNPMGAGKWWPEFNIILRGADVVICGDNDEPGRNHVRLVARNLHGVATRVRVLDLKQFWPAIEESDDVTDWFERGGGTIERLWEIVESLSDWQPESGGNGQDEAPDKAESNNEPIITATPYVWRDPKLIVPRDFLYGYHFTRRYLSGTVAMGGVGKSSELGTEIAAMITGRDLLGIKPKRPLRVWYINLEDPREEIDRKLAAVWQHYDIRPADIAGRLFVDSGRERKVVVARETKGGLVIAVPLLADICKTVLANKIDVVMIDPFVGCYEINENDNSKISAVCQEWAVVAEIGCAVDLAHHVRKGGSRDGHTIEDARGASALINSCRSVRVLNTMTKEEGEKAGVERHRSSFRIDNGKANLTQPPEQSEWRKFVSIDLDNATEESDADRVGVVTAWCWPDPMDSLTTHHLRLAQKAVSEGGPWRKDSQAKNWVGIPIAAALGLDRKDKAHANKIKEVLKIWLSTGMFKEVDGKDEKSNLRTFIEVDKWAND